MRSQRLALLLTLVNLVLLVLLVAVLVVIGRARTTPIQAGDGVLRAHGVELVDEQGRVRSRLDVEPDGEVVLRLLDQHGTIRVKLGASEGGSGLLLLDETTEPAVHLVARRESTDARPTTTSLVLTGAGGQRRAITP